MQPARRAGCASRGLLPHPPAPPPGHAPARPPACPPTQCCYSRMTCRGQFGGATPEPSCLRPCSPPRRPLCRQRAVDPGCAELRGGGHLVWAHAHQVGLSRARARQRAPDTRTAAVAVPLIWPCCTAHSGTTSSRLPAALRPKDVRTSGSPASLPKSFRNGTSARRTVERAARRLTGGPPLPCRRHRSRYQLEYSQAQGIADGEPPRPGQEVAPEDTPLLRRNLRLLAALAEHRRRLRLEVSLPPGPSGSARRSPALPVHWLCSGGAGSQG